MSLNLTQILAADDLRPFTVKTPEWAVAGDDHVCLLPMTGNDRDWYDQMQSKKRFPRDKDGNIDEAAVNWQGLRAAAVARQLCDEQGVRCGASDLDVVALGNKSGAALDRCFEKLQKASGLDADAVEDAEKNSPPAKSDGSG